jgi:hypothetical protein
MPMGDMMDAEDLHVKKKIVQKWGAVHELVIAKKC